MMRLQRCRSRLGLVGLRAYMLRLQCLLGVLLCMALGCGAVAGIPDVDEKETGVNGSEQCGATGSSCSVTAQCGCDVGERCVAGEGDRALQTQCTRTQGFAEASEFCETNEECKTGLHCFQGLCRPYCSSAQVAGASDTSGSGCEDGSCVVVMENPDVAQSSLEVCAARCRNDGDCEQDQYCGLDDVCVGCARDREVDQCDPLGAQCGCAIGSTCVWREEGTTCVEPGTLAAAQACSRVSDCEAGSTCYLGVCAAFCDPTTDCYDAKNCDLLSPGVAACTPSCDPLVENSCSEGLSCVGEGRCVQPQSPCPAGRVEDGVCDGPAPFGTGICAAHTDDEADCCDVQAFGDSANCDPLRQCGCGSSDSSCGAYIAEDNSVETYCRDVGTKQEGDTCDLNVECGLGLTCLFGICTSYCDPGASNNCFGGNGLCLEEGDEGLYGVCLWRCDASAQETGCADGLRCVSWSRADFCVDPYDPCPERYQGDEICDGPSGSQLCVSDEDDPVDCLGGCPPGSEPPDGLDCNPLGQCGCQTGEACYISSGANSEVVGACLEQGTVDVGGDCVAANDCAEGTTCLLNTCDTFCRPDVQGDCEAGFTCIFYDNIPNVGICHRGCDLATGDGCEAGQTCTSVGGEGNEFGLCI